MLALVVGSSGVSAHPYWMVHAHYIGRFCNTATGALEDWYQWQYPSGAYLTTEFRFVTYGCGIA